MNKERYQEIINEAYDNYSKEYEKDNSVGLTMLVQRVDGKSMHRKPNIEMFVTMCKHDKTFSEKWGLKIEERELSFTERIKCIVDSLKSNAPLLMEEDEKTTRWLNDNNIPIKLITVAYKDEKIKVYE